MKTFFLVGLSLFSCATGSSCDTDETNLMQLNTRVQHRATSNSTSRHLVDLEGQLAALARNKHEWAMPSSNQGKLNWIGRQFVGSDPTVTEDVCTEDKYEPSPIELAWTAHAAEWTTAEHCAHMTQQDADSWIEQNQNGKFDPRIFSKNCKKGKAPQFIEPLAGILRDPRFACAPRGTQDLFSVDWLVFPENKANPKLCAQAEGEMCQCDGQVTYGKKHADQTSPGQGSIATFEQTRTTSFVERAVKGTIACSYKTMGKDPMPGHFKHCYCHDVTPGNKVLEPGNKARFYDAGGSHFNDALKFFLETYKGHGIPFDEVYVWEYNTIGKEPYWAGVEPEIRAFWEPRLTFYDATGVTAEKGSPNNPVSRIFKDCKPEDYCVFKLDIDTPTIEYPLAMQLLETPNESKAKLDEFFFEHHVTGIMQQWWGNIAAGTWADSYKLFSSIRHLGIRAHSWV